MGTQHREDWVDVARGIGILLVVYGHTARGVMSADIEADRGLLWLVDSIVYTFHMPLFLFLSGLFFCGSLRKRGGLALILSKVDTILYPYVLWSLLQGGIEVLMSRYTNGDVTMAQVLDLNAPRAQFWFLYILFVLTVIGTLVYRRLQPRFYGLVVAAAAVLFVQQGTLPDFPNADYLYYSLVFFAAGIWFSLRQEAFMQHRRALVLPFLALFALGQWLFHAVLGLSYKDIGLPLLLLAGVSILAVVLVSGVLGEHAPGWLLTVGASSMAIYLMHILAGSGMRVLLQRFLGIEALPIHLVAGTVMGVLLPLAALAVIQRWNLMFLIEAPRPVSGHYWYRRLYGT